MTARTLSISAFSIAASLQQTKPVQSCSLALPLSSLSWPSLVHEGSRSAGVVTFSLPTAKPDRSPKETIPKWTATAIRAYGMAALEASKMMFPKTGTEGLLMGILTEGTSLASRFLHANGITLLGVRKKCEELSEEDENTRLELYGRSLPECPPYSEAAQRVLDWATDEKIKSGEKGEVTASHMLLGIWQEKEDLGRKALEALGFNDERAVELAESLLMNKYDTVLPKGKRIYEDLMRKQQ